MDDNAVIKVSGNSLSFAGKTYRCAIGKNGFSVSKKEGDNCTPVGIFHLRELWYRSDKLATPLTKLPLRIIAKDDGWCDAVSATEYNRHVKLPYELSHEKLWREDDLYNLIVPLGYNDDPVISGKGSAIFMHVAKSGYLGTEGCVALKQEDLLDILPYLSVDTNIHII